MFRTGSRRIVANALTANTIVKREDGYHVVSEQGGKNLGGPYKSRGEAEKRLAQVEYFKHTSNAAHSRAALGVVANGDDPAKTILTNPSRGELQALFDTVHENRPIGSQGDVLRGVHNEKTGNHVWGSAYDYEHLHLADAGTKQGLSGLGRPDPYENLRVPPDGRIRKPSASGFSYVSHDVPGVGSALKPAKGHVTNVGAQGYEAVRDSAGSGTNPYPTRPPTEPETDPAPLAEWETPPDGPGHAQRPVKPASRYQQPWAYQDVGQGKRAGRTKANPNRGPLEY